MWRKRRRYKASLIPQDLSDLGLSVGEQIEADASVQRLQFRDLVDWDLETLVQYLDLEDSGRDDRREGPEDLVLRGIGDGLNHHRAVGVALEDEAAKARLPFVGASRPGRIWSESWSM
jgi:hypothetical protein